MTVIDLQNGRRPVSAEELRKQRIAVALGNFDGVHVGHAALLRTAAAAAAESGGKLKSAVWTFSAHPQKEGAAPVLSLTTTEEKLEIFSEYGIDYVILEDFSAVRHLSPEQFVADILCRSCNAAVAVCGFNFRFGFHGAGTPETLARELGAHGGRTIQVPPIFVRNTVVSSTRIRICIESGRMEEAADYLGRPFFIRFPVVYGNQLGRSIGIPTINQNFPPLHIIPARGIYACSAEVGGRVYPGVANVGSRPTVSNEGRINCETHIIHYSGWLYGAAIKVSFFKKLRDEKKFPSVEALKEAVKRDIADAAAYFEKQRER